jgi:hypothetical protein
MDDHHLLPVAAAIAVALLALRAAGYPTYPFTVCGASSFYKPNSTYQAHLDLAAATVPSNASASPDLFAAAVVGAVPEQLWAMGLCRGDVSATTCFTCLTQAFLDLPNYCSYQKDARQHLLRRRPASSTTPTCTSSPPTTTARSLT